MFKSARSRLRAAVFACAAALGLGAYAADYTGTGYEPWSYSAGCVVWRGTSGQVFHTSTIADVAADGTIGSTYNLNTTGHPWQAFASNGGSNYTAPGLTLVFDEAGYNGSSDAQFAPLSFGGLWVKVLQADDTPYCITDSKTDNTDRTVELGAADASTYFKFEKSFTFNRNSATKVIGTATVDIDSGATFTINARANKGAIVDADASLFLTGEGTLAVVGGLTVNGALDLSGATKPTISGDVTLAGGSTIILPENTVVDATHPFTVCTGTLSSSGDVVYVKIGGGDPVKAFVTVSGGAITAVSTLATYSATIDGDTVFSNIAWEKDGQAATISDMSTAILDISGSGVVTGLASAPAKVTLASGVTLDATSIPAADFAAIVKSTSGTYRWTANHPLLVPQNYTYEFVGGATDAEQVTISGESYFNNSGNLKTTGYIKFSDFWTGYTTATLDIISGQTVIDASNDKALRGTVTIRASAELVNSKTADALAYGAYTVVNVYGTLTMGSTRWTVGNNNTINMYGGTITGAGQSSNGALDFISESSLNVNETCEITASVRFRNALIPVTVAAEKTLTLSGTIRGYGANGEIGGVSKRGAGNLTFKSAPNNLSRGIEHKDGHLVFNTQDDVTITNTYNTAATNTRSLWYARQSNWKGTVKVTDLTGNLTWLTGAGNANSTISLQNVDNAYVIAAANSTYAIPGTLSIDGVTVFNNGSSGSTMSISNLTGSSQLVLAGWGGCSSVRYNLLNVDADWAGTLVVSNGITRTQGGTLTIGIGNIESANTNPGACVLPITNVALEDATGNVVYNLDNATLNGAAADLEVKSDGVYVRNNVTISVPVVANTTITVSVGGEPVAPATESGTTNTYSVASGATVTVTYTSDDYEVTGGTFEFTATDGYTVNTAEVVTKQYVASITVGETTTKCTTLQAAIDAVAQNKDIVLLANEADGATVAREVTFNIVPGEYTYGDIAAGRDYILTTTALEGKTRYTFAQAVIAVTINEVRTLYTMMTANTGIEAANAGPIGTTIEILSGNPAAYVEHLPMFDLNTDTGVFTKVADPVAAVYDGVLQVQVYRTLAEAVAAAENGQTVKLLADVTLDSTVVVTNSLTLDLNGFGIAATDARALWIKAGTVSITGEGVVSANGNGLGETSSVIRVGDGATNANAAGLTIGASVAVESAKCYGVTAFGKNTPGITLEVNGTVAVTSSGEADAAISGNGSPGLAETYITINSGATVTSANSAAIYNPGAGTLTVNGGTITGKHGIVARAGSVAVNGGTITATGTAQDAETIGDSANVIPCAAIAYDAGANYPGFDDGTAIAVTGGTFTSNVDSIDTTGEPTVAVSGGEFSSAVPAEYCAEGYEPTDDGEGHYTVRVDLGWIYEAEDHPNYTGGWSNSVAYAEDHKIKIEDGNTYTANRPSAGQLVTVAMTLSFDDVNDDDSDFGDAKAAIRLAAGETDGTYQFQLYTSDGANKVWTNATVVGVTATKEVDYNFVIVLDLTNKIYTASVVSGTTTNALTIGENVTEIPFACQGEITPVQQIDFVGAGKVSSIEGSYETPEPPPAGFVEDEEVTLYGGKATLTEAQAEWLNACGDKAAVNAKIATMTEAAFNNAYLLNLDVTASNSGYTFAVKGIVVGEGKVDVTVTLTREGALTENEKAKPIVGTLKLKGTAVLGTEFTVLGETAVKFDADADFSDDATETTVTVDTTETDAKFYLPVIE